MLRIQFVGILILIMISSVLELLGVSAILPLINIIMKPEVMFENEYCAQIAEIFQVKSPGEFAILVSFGLAVVYIVKNLFLIYSDKASDVSGPVAIMEISSSGKDVTSLLTNSIFS